MLHLLLVIFTQGKNVFNGYDSSCREGRLSEIFGVETLPFDKMFRTVGLSRTAKMIKEKMNPEALKLLEAYSRGVNFYLEEKKNKLSS